METAESNMVAVLTPPVDWGPFQNWAFGLALLRYTKVMAHEVDGLDLHQALRAAGATRAFFAILGQAEGAILNHQQRANVSFETATAMALHDDLRDPEAALQRDLRMLQEYDAL
ncbi:hypothetical protein [Rhodovulum steppense]|uniref:hypothetical protein n=1 Tax=Rhodovulum steppense TaxID=540251 RepID=UPI00104D2F59|nr:hypothetical protein [Rhodovulum steppense]